jgi:hypothetical protein
MKIIREKHNVGCYNPPLKRNLIPRFTKEGARENDEVCIGQGDQRILDS